MPVLVVTAAPINIFILQWVKGQRNLKGVAHGGGELSPVCAAFERLLVGLLLQPQFYCFGTVSSTSFSPRFSKKCSVETHQTLRVQHQTAGEHSGAFSS